MIYCAPISTRNQWGWLLTENDLMGQAVEVGTHRAGFANLWLSNWMGAHLWCVDPWENLPDYERQVPYLADSDGRENDFKHAQNVIKKYWGRACLLRETSEVASRRFQPESLDCVYIDGNHVAPHPANDLEMWWPKVVQGGIIGGHDFICPGEINDDWGKYIQPAVLQFVEKHQLDLYLVVEEGGNPWTYYMFKR